MIACMFVLLNNNNQTFAKMKAIKLNTYTTSNELAEIKPVYKTKQKATVKITGSDTAAKALREAYDTDTIELAEQFTILILNRQNNVIGWVRISSGGTAGTVVDKKIVFAIALQTNAASIILCHNHPSGNLEPSKTDELLTNDIVKAGKILDIPVLDHIILTADDYCSFADEGLI